MADKAISELVLAQSVTPESLFVLQQDNTAKKLTAQVLENWLLSFADGHGGIQSHELLKTVGLVKTYRFTLADQTYIDIDVVDGRGIESVKPTSTNGLVVTYTVTYNDSTTSTFTVTNGAKGDKGDRADIWVKYASQKPTASSHSFGDVPDAWIGIAIGHNMDTAPTDWQQYTWYQWKGEKGDTGEPATLVSSQVTYQVGDSGTVLPSGSWQNSIPTVTPGKFLWTRQVLQFNTGGPITSYSVTRFGIDGSGSVSTVAGVAPDANGNVPLTADSVKALPIGGGVMAGPINMNGQKLRGLTLPTENEDAATKGYADRYKYYVTPQMFGAKANNQDDDTAAIQTAIDFVEGKAGGTVFFPNGVYVISDTLRVKWHGVRLLGDCMQATYIRQSNVNKCAIEFHNDNGVTLSGVTLDHISVFCDDGSTDIGIHLNGCVNANVSHCIIEGFKIGLNLSETGNTFVNSVGVTSDVDNAAGFQHGNHSVSTQYTGIYAGFYGAAADTGIGFVASQGNIADFTINYLDVGNGAYGVYIDGAEAPSEYPAADIRLYEIVCDGCRQRCIDIKNIGERGSVLIVGGWLNPIRSANVRCLNIDYSSNVIAKGVTFHQLADSEPTFFGVTAYQSKNVTIETCHFINVLNPLSLASIERWNITGNLIDLYATKAVQSNGIYCGSAVRTNIIGNVIKGTFLHGIQVDASSSKCIVSMNNVDGSIVTVSAADSNNENNLM